LYSVLHGVRHWKMKKLESVAKIGEGNFLTVGIQTNCNKMSP
jgi:hypothetical protein